MAWAVRFNSSVTLLCIVRHPNYTTIPRRLSRTRTTTFATELSWFTSGTGNDAPCKIHSVRVSERIAIYPILSDRLSADRTTSWGQPFLGVADFVLSSLALVNLLFGGGITTGLQIPGSLRWIRYVIISFYAHQALLHNQFGGKYSGDEQLGYLLRRHGFDKFLTEWFSMLMMLIIGMTLLLTAVFALTYTTAHWHLYPSRRVP
ncbi:hypothetical protein PSACC_00712 [Paramicrosporidium saccamoebae]|uniref:Uncharacterized protein n=1 Tax=Paramicrosporidium saccamoebae TaxID=1246581 RepID=A0A2H9TNV3_9FUNG|nr:hypothetical protein PSACC_00712 [Paramicrosporidium saccamoebae]